MTNINFIGLGHWGPNLVRAFINSQRATVGTVCDLSQSRLATIQRNISASIRTSTDPLATATDPAADAVVIATPTNTHYALAKAALEAGKHVLVEKPLAGSVDDAEALVALAHQRGRLLAVGHVFLFNAGIRAVKNLIARGDLGSIRYIFSTRTNLGPFRTDVNALWDLGAHDVSIFNYWLDAEPHQATAYGTSYLTPGVEDVVVANFKYPGEVQACVHASWLNPQKVREITVVGERQMIVWNDMDLNEPVRIYHKSVDVERSSSERDPAYVDSFGAFRMLVRSGDVVIPKIDAGQPLDAECQHFLDCVEGKATLLNDSFGGLQVVRALAAAEQSMRNQSILTEVGGVLHGAAAA